MAITAQQAQRFESVLQARAKEGSAIDHFSIDVRENHPLPTQPLSAAYDRIGMNRQELIEANIICGFETFTQTASAGIAGFTRVADIIDLGALAKIALGNVTAFPGQEDDAQESRRVEQQTVRAASGPNGYRR